MAEEKKKETKKEKWGVGQIATQTERTIINNETGDAADIIEILASIKNDLEEIKKSLNG